MPSITIDLPPEKSAALKAMAQAQGLTLDQWILRMVDEHIAPSSIAALQKSDPDEWARRFHDWAESHDRTTPLLSDDSVRREDIYPDLC